MNYIGKWRFHSIGVINESGELIYLSAEEYLNSPMPYIDETDEDAVADEMRERAEKSLECAMDMGLSFTIADLVEHGRPVHPDTVDAYNDIKLQE